jgi:hypothetical protein
MHVTKTVSADIETRDLPHPDNDRREDDRSAASRLARIIGSDKIRFARGLEAIERREKLLDKVGPLLDPGRRLIEIGRNMILAEAGVRSLQALKSLERKAKLKTQYRQIMEGR